MNINFITRQEHYSAPKTLSYNLKVLIMMIKAFFVYNCNNITFQYNIINIIVFHRYILIVMLQIKNLNIIEYTKQDSNTDGLFAVLRSNHHTTVASAKYELFADYIKIYIIRVSQCDYNIIKHAYSSQMYFRYLN